MSLFELPLLIGLSPESVSLQQRSRWARRTMWQEKAIGSAAVGPLLEQLQALLDLHGAKSRRWRIALSNYWARYLVTPWSDAFLQRESSDAYVRGVLAHSFGEAVAAWPCRLGLNKPGLPVLLVLMEPSLHEGLQAFAHSQGASIEALYPFQLIALQKLLPQRPDWVAIVEPQVVSVALCRGDYCQEILQEPNVEGVTLVADMLERWQWRSGEVVGSRGIAIAADDSNVLLPATCQRIVHLSAAASRDEAWDYAMAAGLA